VAGGSGEEKSLKSRSAGISSGINLPGHGHGVHGQALVQTPPVARLLGRVCSPCLMAGDYSRDGNRVAIANARSSRRFSSYEFAVAGRRAAGDGPAHAQTQGAASDNLRRLTLPLRDQLLETCRASRC
jgi:hypothetical protein